MATRTEDKMAHCPRHSARLKRRSYNGSPAGQRATGVHPACSLFGDVARPIATPPITRTADGRAPSEGCNRLEYRMECNTVEMDMIEWIRIAYHGME